MATNDDALLRQRVRPQSTLLEMKPAAARQPAVETPEETGTESSALDDFAALPQPGSAYDAAHSRASNKPVPTLRFVMGDAVRGLPYANFDSIDWQVADKPGASPAIVIRFTGLVAREVVIAGRHLLKLYDLLSHHRVAWVRQLPKGKDFRDKDDKATVITGITISRITEVPA
jgi:hypothetical protein